MNKGLPRQYTFLVECHDGFVGELTYRGNTMTHARRKCVGQMMKNHGGVVMIHPDPADLEESEGDDDLCC